MTAQATWYRSRWALISGGIVLVAILLAIAAPYLFNVDHFRPLIDRFLESSTGHKVTIESLRFHLLPTARVQAANVRVQNPQGFPAGDAVVIGSIDLGIALRPLLARRLEVTRIALNDVQVNLLHNASGRSNLGGPPAPDTDDPVPASGGRAVVSLGRVGAVTVTNAQIAFGPALRVTGLRATMNAVDLSAADWTQQLAITANLADAEVTTSQLTKPLRVTSGDLRVKSTGAQARFSVSLEDARADATITVSAYNPLTVRFALTVPELNAAALSQVMGRRDGAGGPPAGAGPKRFLAGGTVKIAKLVAHPLTLSNVNASLRVHTTSLEIAAFSLAGYGGTAAGSGVVTYSARGVPATVSARIRGVNLAQLLGAMGSGAAKITGTLQATARLSVSLGGDIRRTVAGTGTFAVANGSFPGMEMQISLAKLAKAFQIDVAGGTTKFQLFSGSVRVANQRVTATNLTLDAVGFVSTAQGSMGFDGTLNFTGTGHLAARAGPSPPPANVLQRIEQGIAGTVARGLQGVRVPFTLTGTLTSPQFTLAGSVVVTEELPPRQQQPKESPAD